MVEMDSSAIVPGKHLQNHPWGGLGEVWDGFGVVFVGFWWGLLVLGSLGDPVGFNRSGLRYSSRPRGDLVGRAVRTELPR